MTKVHNVRRGENENIINVKYTYTLLLDIFEMYQLGEEDEITLRSHDDAYTQTLVLGKDGEIVEDRWVKVTFTKVKPQKLYSCELNPLTIASYGSGEDPDQATFQGKLIKNKNQASKQSNATNASSRAGGTKEGQDRSQSSHPKFIVFNKVPLDVKDFNKVGDFEESPLSDSMKILESQAIESLPKELAQGIDDLEEDYPMDDIENSPLDAGFGLAEVADIPEDAEDGDIDYGYEIDSEDVSEFEDTEKSAPYNSKYLDAEEKIFEKMLQEESFD